jgi:flagellar basal body-associated protein FliL
MKKTIIIIIISIFIIIICTIYGMLITKRSKQNEVNKQNNYYEKYLNKEIYGTEVATIINKTVNQNEQNEIQKDQNNYYIDNRYKFNKNRNKNDNNRKNISNGRLL